MNLRKFKALHLPLQDKSISRELYGFLFSQFSYIESNALKKKDVECIVDVDIILELEKLKFPTSDSYVEFHQFYNSILESQKIQYLILERSGYIL